MKDKRQDSFERLKHIQKAILEIERFTKSISVNKFIQTDILNNAVLFQFSVIGEAINYVEKEILIKYKYPWFKVRSFRNLIAHEYYNVKLEAVWLIINNDLPELKKNIDAILKNEFKS